MANRHSNGKPSAQKSLIPAVGYIRMSTDRQEHSPERQRAEIIEMAERDGYNIIKWYEDHGLTGTESANRPEFQRLLQNASDGRFQVILLYEQSRFSREDIFDVMSHWRLLRQAGVDIVTCQRGRLRFDDLGGILTAIIDQHGAREESLKLAQRVVSGQRQRAKRGLRNGGTVFGYDREIRDETGKPVRRVHFQEKFRRPSNWTTHLVPSADTTAVEAVQWAFESIRQGGTVADVLREFNSRGLRTTFGNKFTFSSMKGLLQNPAYTGLLRVGHYTKGKFCNLAEDGPILIEDSHEPLVSAEHFEEVQQQLSRRHKRQERCPPGTYLFTGIVRCQHCERSLRWWPVLPATSPLVKRMGDPQASTKRRSSVT